MSPIPLGIFAVSGAAPAGTGAFDLISSNILTSNTTTVTFSGLGSLTDYEHLQLRIVGRNSSTSTGNTNMWLRFDASTSNYRSHRLRGDGSNVTTGTTTGTVIEFGPFIPGNGVTSGIFGTAIIDILDFSSSKQTVVRALHGSYISLVAAQVGLSSGWSGGTTAITSISLLLEGGNWLAGSRLSLYGIKG